MYFPYLRGRQFELLALRELLEGRVKVVQIGSIQYEWLAL